MKFIAYTFKGRKEVHSAAHDTREAAAQELFAANAKLHRVETAVAVHLPHTDKWETFGKDIRSVSRLEAAKALKQTPTTRVEQFANVPMLWVVHVNAFTRKIESAYLLAHGVKNGGHITAAQFGREMVENPDTPVEFLKV